MMAFRFLKSYKEEQKNKEMLQTKLITDLFNEIGGILSARSIKQNQMIESQKLKQFLE